MIYFRRPYHRQEFSFPDSIIYYMIKNPISPKIYEKLIQCCKYFFSKNPIIVIPRLKFDKNGSGWKVVRNGYVTKIDITNVSNKLWITDALHIYDNEDTANEIPLIMNVASSIVPKFYKCDVTKLSLTKQNIFFNEYLMLALNVKLLAFVDVIVRNLDGTLTSVEKLVECASKLKEFCLVTVAVISPPSTKTVEELLKLPHFFTLDNFVWASIPEVFDITKLYNYIKKNNTQTKFFLCFTDQLSDEYQNLLESIIDEIIETEKHVYQPPFIGYAGMYSEKYKKIESIYDGIL
uniref:Uncharacterized protein n=1 Tax=Panagrolaimus sp. PS1159 TaxID=55785 RepID=A0AC35FHT7_9BILA